MTRFAFATDEPYEIFPGRPFRGPDGQSYPANWLAVATPQARTGRGIKAIAETQAPPGKRIVSTSLQTINGVPTEVHVLEDIPLAERKSVLVQAIDAERDRRQQLDFAYDFGETEAIDDAGNVIAAGVRSLQMRFDPDQRNWQALQSVALAAAVAGGGDTVMPMRAEDNWNVQTTANEVQTVAAAMMARNGAILFYGGALKSQVRAATSANELNAIDIAVGWPG
jgi:hypothetical protein